MVRVLAISGAVLYMAQTRQRPAPAGQCTLCTLCCMGLKSRFNASQAALFLVIAIWFYSLY